MTDTLRPPSLRVQVPRDDPSSAWSSSSTPTLRRRRLKMRRTKKATSERLENGSLRHSGSRLASKEYLQLPAIEITPSSDEDVPWSNCSTPSASPRRKRFLIRKWLKVREKKEPANESRLVFEWHLSGHTSSTLWPLFFKCIMVSFYQFLPWPVQIKINYIKSSILLILTFVTKFKWISRRLANMLLSCLQMYKLYILQVTRYFDI